MNGIIVGIGEDELREGEDGEEREERSYEDDDEAQAKMNSDGEEEELQEGLRRDEVEEREYERIEEQEAGNYVISTRRYKQLLDDPDLGKMISAAIDGKRLRVTKERRNHN